MKPARPWVHGLATAAALAVWGCAAPPPPPPPPTIVQLKLSATRDVNANPSGQGAPVVVRVYQLASPAAFEKAEFFRLMNADATALGADLVKKDEYLLAPGTTKQAELTIPAPVKALGIMAAYRQFQSTTWRITVPIPPNKTTPAAITAGAPGLAAAP